MQKLFKRRVLAYTLVLVLCLTQIPLFISSSEADDEPNYRLQYLPQEDYVGNESGWPYNRSIIINHEFIDEELTNFPILVSETSEDFIAFAQDDADDIVFTNKTGEFVYNHEIEKYDSSTGELVCWVNVTTLSATEDTVIIMHYGNETCGPQSSPEETWDGNFVGVWHMSDYNDSSYPHYNTTVNNSAPGRNLSGIAAGCFDFDDEYDGLLVEDDPIFNYSTSEDNFTYEAWLNRPAIVYSSTYSNIIGDFHGPCHQLRSNNTLLLYLCGYACSPPISWETNKWYHFVTELKGKWYQHFLNKENQSAVFINCDDFRNPNIFMIAEDEKGEHFNGSLDEIRISEGVRSWAWINATYDTINQSEGFMTIYPQSNFYESDYTCWDSFTIESDFITEDLNDFPVLIQQKSNSYAKFAQHDGDDFVFTNATNETVFNHEIERYNSTSGELTAWVNLTHLDASSDTTINLHYGNPYCGPRQNITGVWDGHYIGVWHMCSYNDSSVYSNDVIYDNGTIVDENGSVGSCYSFNMTYMNVSGSDSLDAMRNITVEILYKIRNQTTPTGKNQVHYFMQKGGPHFDNYDAFAFFIRNYTTYETPTNLYMWLEHENASGNYSNYASSGFPYCFDTWFYYAISVDNDTKEIRYNNNGTYKGLQTLNGDMANGVEGYNLTIGMQIHSNPFWFFGEIDEIRLSDSIRNDSWINASYEFVNQTPGLVTYSPQDDFYEDMFKYHTTITIDHDFVDEDINEFPILIQDTNLRYIQAQSNGNDFAFSNTENTTLLSHELELFNDTSGRLTAWVNLTHLDASADTVIILHYGNETCDSFETPNDVWDEHYVGVWHMSSYNDSSTYSNDIVYDSGCSMEEGKVGNCYSFNYSHMNVSHSKSLELYNKTFEGLFSMRNQTYTAANFHYLFQKGGLCYDCNDSYTFHLVNYSTTYGTPTTYRIRTEYVNTSWNYTINYSAAISYCFDCWLYPAVTIDNASKVINMYHNSTFRSTHPVYGDFTNFEGNLTIGMQYMSHPFYLYGEIDELRISNVVRNDSWLNASHDSVNQTAGFITFGQQSGFDETMFACHKTVVINHDYIDEDLNDFPIFLQDTDLSYTLAQSDGSDFVFTDTANETIYNHEIETFNTTTGTIAVWINVSHLDASQDTTIIMHYGNASCDSFENPDNIWDDNYSAVWHMNDLFDSSSYDNHIIDNSGAVLESGKAGSCYNFSNNSMNVSDSDSLDVYDATFEFLFKVRHTPERWSFLMEKRNSSNDKEAYAFTIRDDTGVDVSTLDLCYEFTNDTWTHNTEYFEPVPEMNLSSWYYLVVVVDNSTDKVKEYLNGSYLEVDSKNPGIIDTEYPLSIGWQFPDHKYALNGYIDEIRISNGFRNDSWMNATFDFINQSDGILTFGSQSGFDEGQFDNWRIITINHDYIDEDLTDFPVLVYESDSSLTTHVQPDGDDFAFSNLANDTQYDHEIELYNSTSGEIWAWVKIPTVSSTVDTQFVMHYGNDNCGSQENVEDVWDVNYTFVVHFGETSGSYVDSAHSVSTTEDKIDVFSRDASGIAGYCPDFERTSQDEVRWATNDYLNLTGDMTIEAWVKPETFEDDAFHTLFMKGVSGSVYINYYMLFDKTPGSPGGNLSLCIFDNDPWSESSNPTYEGVWMHAVGTYNATGDNYLDLYQNGTEVNYRRHNNQSDTNVNGSDLWIGNNEIWGNEQYDGLIDEVRLSDICRTDEWISASFHTSNQTAGFMTVGPHQPQQSSFSPVLSNEEPSNTTIDVPLYSWLNITVTDEDNGPFNITWVTNVSGSWEAFAWNSSSGNGTFRQRATWADTMGTYHWGVRVNDSFQEWANETYWFTTADYTWSNWSAWWTFTYNPSCSPTNLSAIGYNETAINLTWDTCEDGADTYVLVMNESGWSSHPLTPSNGTEIYNGTNDNYNHTGLANSTTYYFTVWGWNDTESGYSLENDTAEASTFGDVMICCPYPPNLSTDNARPPTNVSIRVNGTNLNIYLYFNNMTDTSNGTILFANWSDETSGYFSFDIFNWSAPGDEVTDWIWGNVNYIWYVNVTDGVAWHNRSYSFTTTGARHDVDGSGDVIATDASRVWSHRTGETTYNGIYDVNYGGDITATDASIVWANRT